MAGPVDYASAGVGFADGRFMPFSELTIPVSDMGFQLSDMCYDAVHVRNGRFFRLEDHLDRWERSIAARRYATLEYDRDGVARVLHECVARAGLRDSMITFLATRGTPSSGYKDLRTARNRLFAWALPYYSVVTEEEMETGCDVVVAKTVRIPPDSVDPRVKNFGRLDFVHALFEAYDRDARYAVLLDHDGNVTEGRGWNIFALRGGALLSPESGVLEGITRTTVLELARDLNVEPKLTRFSADVLRGADEVFLTSTAGGIVPVRRIDGRPLGDGAPGPVTTRLTAMYWALHDDPAFSTPVDYTLAAAAE